MRSLWWANSLVVVGLLMTGCGNDSNSNNTTSMYKVTVTNLTYAQPLSPIVVALHDKTHPLFKVGTSASSALELLAEGGDNSEFLETIENAVGTHAPIPPGRDDAITIEGKSTECMSIVTMLVNSNDAFTGATCIDINGMQTGDTLTLEGITYDAGTEANSEHSMHIPGPVGNGEGYNAMRDDRNFVSVHGGVVTKDDGLPSSALTIDHRWDHPTVMIRIEKL